MPMLIWGSGPTGRGDAWLNFTTPRPGHHLIRPPNAREGLYSPHKYPRAQRAWHEIANKKCGSILRGHGRKKASMS